MTDTAQPSTQPAPAPPTGADPARPARRRKTPAVLSVLVAALALAVGLAAPSGQTTFRLATAADFFAVPDVVLPSRLASWVAVALCALLAVEAWRRSRPGLRQPLWLPAVFGVVAVTGFLTWAAADSTVPVIGLLGGSIALAVPLVFGALGGVLGERAGVVNIAIEGQLLAGAFAAALVGSLAGSAWLGVAGAAVAGTIVAALLALFAITYLVEQVIVGVVLNVLVIAVTSFLFSQVLTSDPAAYNTPPRLSTLSIPVLGDVPVLGPILFRQPPLVYLLYVAVAVVTWALYRTRWGLRVRAVGEHPKAADTVGIDVTRTRYRTLLLAGAIVGAGGAFYTLVSVQGFDREMTGGAGYIALAAVIFGKWDPIRATMAALLFGFVSNLQGTLAVIGSPVPSQFLLMLPYLVTVVAVAGLVGRSRAPAAVGLPYKKG